LTVQSGKLAGKTVREVLTMANRVLGGDLAALPPRVTIANLNTIVETINANYARGAVNRGYLK
jgi:hypothetical protein